jgi:protein TonB
MFDLAAGTIERPFRDKHAAASLFAVTSHVVVLGGIALAGLFFGVADKLPEVPRMLAFVAEAPPPPPPPPPSLPTIRAQREPQPPTAPPASGPTFMAPAAIPTGIPPESAVDLGDEGGVPGGVPGGIPGGVVGGVIMEEAPPLPPPLRKPARVGGDIKAPALIHRVEPIYPPIAVKAKVTGMVILEATVDEAGDVTNVVVLRSIPLLDNASLAAVRQWRYEPLRLNGVPSPFILTVTLTFSLK